MCVRHLYIGKEREPFLTFTLRTVCLPGFKCVDKTCTQARLQYQWRAGFLYAYRKCMFCCCLLYYMEPWNDKGSLDGQRDPENLSCGCYDWMFQSQEHPITCKYLEDVLIGCSNLRSIQSKHRQNKFSRSSCQDRSIQSKHRQDEFQDLVVSIKRTFIISCLQELLKSEISTCKESSTP